VPKEYGGSEQPFDPLRARVIREEFARAKAPREVDGPGVNMLVPTLLACGAQAQKDRFIRPTIEGKITWC
jgi:alkylation response protein AidB-like acyl-CoA dehydrogenase